ncbi:MAG: ATP-binding cassette domain-containing protein [bacterium]
MENTKQILEAKNITKIFSGTERSVGISDISFSLKEGEVYCLIGPSGAGKSTLLRCLAGLEPIDSGEILLHGCILRDHVAFVSQEQNLWPHKTVIENLILVPLLLGRMGREQAKREALALLVRFGLLDKRDAYPEFLSGGQKQRVAILRALIMKPKLLLLDEITSSLDHELVGNVRELIKTLALEGQAMVIATHQLDFASEVADKILFLDKGLLIKEGLASDLAKSF